VRKPFTGPLSDYPGNLLIRTLARGMPKGRLREFLFFFVRCSAEKGRTERSPLARNATPYDGSVLEIATMRVEGKGNEAIGIFPKMVNHQTRFLEKKGNSNKVRSWVLD
jgi:hypothetical protein